MVPKDADNDDHGDGTDEYECAGPDNRERQNRELLFLLLFDLILFLLKLSHYCIFYVIHGALIAEVFFLNGVAEQVVLEMRDDAFNLSTARISTKRAQVVELVILDDRWLRRFVIAGWRILVRWGTCWRYIFCRVSEDAEVILLRVVDYLFDFREEIYWIVRAAEAIILFVTVL